MEKQGTHLFSNLNAVVDHPGWESETSDCVGEVSPETGLTLRERYTIGEEEPGSAITLPGVLTVHVTQEGPPLGRLHLEPTASRRGAVCSVGP